MHVMHHAPSALSRAAAHHPQDMVEKVVTSGGCRSPFSPVYHRTHPCFLRGFCGLPTSLLVAHTRALSFFEDFPHLPVWCQKQGSQISNSASGRRKRWNLPSDCVPLHLASAADLSKQGGSSAIAGVKFFWSIDMDSDLIPRPRALLCRYNRRIHVWFGAFV